MNNNQQKMNTTNDLLFDPQAIYYLQKSAEAHKKSTNLNLSASHDNAPKDENLDVDKMLNEALKNNDITEDQKKALRETWINEPGKLARVLLTFKQMRVDYLMSLSWEELDKTDGLLKELKEKFLQGYEQKFFVHFGKMPPGTKISESTEKDEIERLIKFAIANKDLEPEIAAQWKVNFKDDLPKLKKLVLGAAQSRIDFLMTKSWSWLDHNDHMEELKRKYLEGFKMKYKEQFGVDYKD